MIPIRRSILNNIPICKDVVENQVPKVGIVVYVAVSLPVLLTSRYVVVRLGGGPRLLGRWNLGILFSRSFVLCALPTARVVVAAVVVPFCRGGYRDELVVGLVPSPICDL